MDAIYSNRCNSNELKFIFYRIYENVSKDKKQIIDCGKLLIAY